MKKWIIGTLLLSASLSFGQVTPQERWTYTGIADNSLLSTAISETGTGSSFGTGASFLTVASEKMRITASGALNESYAEGLSAPAYAGKTTGIYQISYQVDSAAFVPGTIRTGQFGWGLRSNVSGTDDCKVFFQFINNRYELVVHDDTGAKPPVTIQTGSPVLSVVVTVRQVYFLQTRGTPGSFQVFYSIAGGKEQELYAGQLTLPADFQLDEFRMEVNTTANGFKWAPGNFALVDNLALVIPDPKPELALVGQSVSFIEDNGVAPNTPSPTYEPGDVLQVITTNKNIGFGPANNITTTLSADPSSFIITPISNTVESLGLGESYPATFRVDVLNGAPDGAQTFTVINQVGAGAAAMAFEDQF